MGNIRITNSTKIIYPELSYKVIGAAFKVYNNLGWGHREVYYQRALESELKELGLNFEREKSVSLVYNDKPIGRCVMDFVVDNKVVLELKVIPRLGYTHIRQVYDYLKSTKMKLAILIYFTKEGVKYRRVVAGF
ncbi:MAG: GxxExxY protein [Patescibacteria group bacterium]